MPEPSPSQRPHRVEPMELRCQERSTRTQWQCSVDQGHPSACKESLQNRVGNPLEVSTELSSGTWPLHLPVTEPERLHGRGQLREDDLDALPRLEEGSQDRPVLPENPTLEGCNQVHCQH